MTTLVTAEYDGVPYTFRDDGWFNATEAAKRHAKEPSYWLALKETKEYIAALNSFSNTGKNGIWHQSRRGNNGGTWMHPKLAVAFARWLNARLAIWCDMQIDRILRREPLHEDDDRLTTPTDRIPLHMAVPYIYQRTGACFPKIYVAISAAAGADDFPSMTMGNFALVAPFLLRIKNEADTQADWDMLHINGKQLRGSAQLELTFAESIGYNPIKEAS